MHVCEKASIIVFQSEGRCKFYRNATWLMVNDFTIIDCYERLHSAENKDVFGVMK